MTALSESVNRLERDGDVIVLPVAASTTIYQGALLQVDDNGRVQPATRGANKKLVGVAGEYVQNGATAGAMNVEVRRNRLFHFGTTGTAPDVGDDVYADDDNTLTATSTGRTRVGKVRLKDDAGVWVEI